MKGIWLWFKSRVFRDPQDSSWHVIVMFSIKPSQVGVNRFAAIPYIDRTQYTCGFNHLGTEGYPIINHPSVQPIVGHVSLSEIGADQNLGWFIIELTSGPVISREMIGNFDTMSDIGSTFGMI